MHAPIKADLVQNNVNVVQERAKTEVLYVSSLATFCLFLSHFYITEKNRKIHEFEFVNVLSGQIFARPIFISRMGEWVAS